MSKAELFLKKTQDNQSGHNYVVMYNIRVSKCSKSLERRFMDMAIGKPILSLKRAQSPRPTKETLHSRNEMLPQEHL